MKKYDKRQWAWSLVYLFLFFWGMFFETTYARDLTALIPLDGVTAMAVSKLVRFVITGLSLGLLGHFTTREDAKEHLLISGAVALFCFLATTHLGARYGGLLFSVLINNPALTQITYVVFAMQIVRKMSLRSRR